jgi:hypothetical protein
LVPTKYSSNTIRSHKPTQQMSHYNFFSQMKQQFTT